MSSLVEVPRTSLPARGLSAWHPQGGFRPGTRKGLSAWHPQGGFRPGTRKGAFGLAPARGLSAWHPQGVPLHFYFIRLCDFERGNMEYSIGYSWFRLPFPRVSFLIDIFLYVDAFP